jgi:molybdopterin/thiamine biosynthesis adenylyltransferase
VTELSDAQLERYTRHIILKEIGGDGQKRLLDAHVALIGAGGIGAPAIQYLAAAGVGRLS